MDRHRDQRPRHDEPRGEPAAGTLSARWRRAIDWLLGDPEPADRQRLLAERHLMVGRPRPTRRPTDAPRDSERGETRR